MTGPPGPTSTTTKPSGTANPLRAAPAPHPPHRTPPTAPCPHRACARIAAHSPRIGRVKVGASVTRGLLGAWIVHDLEELLTMPAWSQRAPEQIASALPAAPGALLQQLPMSRTEASTAIGLMGILMAAASAAGAATDGRSRLFQASLTGFGLHAATHLAQSLLLKRYTPGLITTPLVVIPFSVCAHHRLRQTNTPIAPTSTRLNLALAAAVPLAHALARLPRLRHKQAPAPR